MSTAMLRSRRDATVESTDTLRAAILSSISAHIAVLDRHGVIIAVNDAWTEFARAHGVRAGASVLPGASYVAVCARAAQSGVPAAAETLAGILAVCEGRSDSYKCEYEFVHDHVERWFAMKVVPLRRAEGGAVVTHRDVTRQKQTEGELRRLSRRLITAQEDERRRIARDLHDDLQQRLALLQIELDGLALGSSDLSAEQVSSRARDLGGRTAEIATELHHLAHRLHPSKLDTLGLRETLASLCRELAEHGLQVAFACESLPASIPTEVALCVFRVVQESLQNVMKHSGVAAARLTMSVVGDTLWVVVADAGCGVDLAAASNHGGLGLVSMRERLQSVGGTMTIRSAAGEGTSVEFDVPIAGNQPSPAESVAASRDRA